MERRRDVHNVGSRHLPPRELWLFTPGKDERLPTPLDERGLVDPAALLEIVKSTIDPAFTWESDEKPDAHHLYWEHNLYPNDPYASSIRRFFVIYL